jgi:hypothetical protein
LKTVGCSISMQKCRLATHVVYISSRSKGRRRRGLYAVLILKSIFYTTEACSSLPEGDRSENFEVEMVAGRKIAWFEGKCKLLSVAGDPDVLTCYMKGSSNSQRLRMYTARQTKYFTHSKMSELCIVRHVTRSSVVFQQPDTKRIIYRSSN